MVGRGGEIERIHQALTRAWAGSGGLVAVIGEAGMGRAACWRSSPRRVTGRCTR